MLARRHRRTEAVRSRGRGGRPADSSAGFTLLELIVAMTVFSLVCVAVYGVLVLGARSASSGERVTEQARRFRVATELISRQLAAAAPISLPRPAKEGLGSESDADNTTEPEPYFFGDDQEVDFVTTAPQRPDASGLAIVRYWIQDGTVRMSETPAYEAYSSDEGLGKDDELSGTMEATLLFDVDSLKLSYRRDPEDDEWLDTWDAADENQLPAAVRVEVGAAVVDGPVWYQEAPVVVGALNQVADVTQDFRGPRRVQRDESVTTTTSPSDDVTTTTEEDDGE